MKDKSARDQAKESSTRFVEELKAQNAKVPAGKLVEEAAYVKLQRHMERLITRYSTER